MIDMRVVSNICDEHTFLDAVAEKIKYYMSDVDIDGVAQPEAEALLAALSKVVDAAGDYCCALIKAARDEEAEWEEGEEEEEEEGEGPCC